MSSTSIRRVLVATWSCAVAFILSSTFALAQNEIVAERPPEYDANSDYKAWFSDVQKAVDPRWPSAVLERYADQLARGRHGEVLRALADEMRKVKWPSHNDLVARFQRRMDSLAAAFAAAEAEAATSAQASTEAQRDAIKAKLDAKGVGVQSLLPEEYRPSGGGAGDLVLAFFAGDDADRIVTYRMTSDDKYELLVPRDLMRDLRLRAESVRAVLQDFVQPVQTRAFDLIKQADRRWKNYLENGYSQYPWESLVNGKLWKFSAFDPPDRQLIFLHPTVGVEMSTVSLKKLVADEVINVELLGYVAYYGDDHENFLGGSIAASLRDRVKPGIGVVFHWNRSVSVGVSWHDLDDDGNPFNDNPFVYLSFDLFRYVQSEGPRFKGEYDKVRALLP